MALRSEKWKWKPWRRQNFQKRWAQEKNWSWKFWAQKSVILNHVHYNNINTDLNLLNQVDSNNANYNQLIPTNSITIIDSADVCALNQLFQWYGDSTDAAASTISTRKPLAWVTSIHTDHTPYLEHPLHLYTLLLASRIFTYGESDPTSPLHDSSAESVTP